MSEGFKRITLGEAQDALEGVMPAVVATCAADGSPNVTYLSKVMFVDAEHFALSNQFFSKTIANIGQNPKAQITVLQPTTGRHFRFDAIYERSEDSGELFERTRAEIDAIASMFGMQDVFRLRAVDIYRVLRGEIVPSDVDG